MINQSGVLYSWARVCGMVFGIVASLGTLAAPLESTSGFVAREGAFFQQTTEGSRPFFVHAVNLGVGIPGTQPGDVAVTRDQYERWFRQIRGLGFTVIRTYTLHFPRFYEAFRDYNLTHPENPLYLLHGVWLHEENPSLDLHELTTSFETNLREAVRAVHGQITIESRPGMAHGSFTADISPWTLGWLIGREIIPFEVGVTDESHPDQTSYAGTYLSLHEGSPTEVWLTERMDSLVRYEWEEFQAARPVGVSSWPTLDPLSHPTENPRSFEDTHTVDLANLDTTAYPPGAYVGYHAYPYYPDFISEDPAYTGESDGEGPNSYLGYLKALRSHYGSLPLLIAEFGLPTSWGNAHEAHSGMDHGGHDETAHGHYLVRMFENIRTSGCAGGAVFAWMDEWWKNSWITSELDFPVERRPLWHNITTPEQNYGLITCVEEPPILAAASVNGTPGVVSEVRWGITHRFFYLEFDCDTTTWPLVVGWDTYGDGVGETVLPEGTTTPTRCEFALLMTGPEEAQLYVTRAYDLFGIWHEMSEPFQLYHSVATDGEGWEPVRWLSSVTSSEDGLEQSPKTIDWIGQLQVHPGPDFLSPRDAVAVGEDRVRIRLPWTLLQFTDPSRAQVMNDNLSTSGQRETVTSEGVRVVIVQAGSSLTSARLTWSLWNDAPLTAERAKLSAAMLADYLLPINGPEEIRLQLSPQSSSVLRADWVGSGELEMAPSVNGPWEPVAGQPPLAVSVPLSEVQFFRVRR